MKPEQVVEGSNKKVWWRCEKGHEWQARICNRTNGNGCPVCENKVVLAGYNDLASVSPELASQWHPTKGDLKPTMVTMGSTKRIWWQCEQGHEWEAIIYSRTSSGHGCPVCTGRAVVPGENDLASQNPLIAAQWHPDRNGELNAQNVTPNCNRKVWWICDKGHEYQAVVAKRTRDNTGCPYCAGRKVLAGFNDLATIRPEVAAEWHQELNGAFTPQMVTVGSNKRAWWQCEKGYVWQALIASRTRERSSGCPVCAKRVNTTRQKNTLESLKKKRKT